MNEKIPQSPPPEEDPQALFEEAARAAAPDMPGEAAPTAYEGAADPFQDVINGAEYATQQTVGDEADRYLRADQARQWAEHYEDPASEGNPTPHPDQDDELTPLAYHMSKAIGPEERAKVLDTYTTQPDKLKLPPELRPPESQ